MSLGLKGSWKWAKRQMLNGATIGNIDWENDLKVSTETLWPHKLIHTREEYLLNADWKPYQHGIHDESILGYYVVGRRFSTT